MAERPCAFFVADVTLLAERLAFQLGDDYGLSEEETDALSKDIEDAVRVRFAKCERRRAQGGEDGPCA